MTTREQTLAEIERCDRHIAALAQVKPPTSTLRHSIDAWLHARSFWMDERDKVQRIVETVTRLLNASGDEVADAIRSTPPRTQRQRLIRAEFARTVRDYAKEDTP